MTLLAECGHDESWIGSRSGRSGQEWLGPSYAAGTGPDRPRGSEEAILDKIREAMEGIEFGSVLIKIHQGEVVGIESTRKARLRGAPGEPS